MHVVVLRETSALDPTRLPPLRQSALIGPAFGSQAVVVAFILFVLALALVLCVAMMLFRAIIEIIRKMEALVSVLFAAVVVLAAAAVLVHGQGEHLLQQRSQHALTLSAPREQAIVNA